MDFLRIDFGCPEVQTILAEEAIQSYMGNQEYICVLPWEAVPISIKFVCKFNGGDEDWLAIVPNHMFQDNIEPMWLDCLDTCREPDRYFFSNYRVYVGSHS